MQSWSAPSWPDLEPLPGRVEIHDSRTGTRREVGPAEGEARLYVCGITPYDATHLGHANTYLAFDLLQRAWRDCGLGVRYVQNVTDVDEPLLERAAATGVDWQELATDQIELFRTDMAALRVFPPQVYLGVVEAMPLVIDFIETLQTTDTLYPLPDAEHPDLYFRCAEDPRFLEVSGLSRDAALAVFAERGGDPDRAGKHDPFDCLVWLQQRDGEPGWDSPFGRGRPGWHIECTAIARHHLGAEFDVQGGGSDLVFPHHEMCASQARAGGAELAQSYVHAGMVGLDGEKMSKSQGNLVLVSTLRAEGHDPMAIRLALLSQHYRTDWSWTGSMLDDATARLDRWRRAVALPTGPDATVVVAAVRAAIRHDLDAPAALAAIDAWADAALAGTGDDAEAPGTGDDAAAPRTVAAVVDAVLGVTLD